MFLSRLSSFIVALSALTACASPIEAGLEEQVSSEIRTAMEEQGLPAISAVVIKGDQQFIVHMGTLASGSAPDNQTLYDIGSITKTHTGLVLAQAVLDGLVKLDDPIYQYLPDFDPALFEHGGEAATIRDLATHVSGMPTNLACDNPSLVGETLLKCFMQHDKEDLLTQLKTMKLMSKPGTEYRYSNAGIRVLGYILEGLYQQPIQHLLEEIVFPKTGQTETQARLSPEEHKRWVVGSHINGKPVPDASDYFNAAGGLKTTLPDMARYLRFYLSDNPLAHEATRLLAGEAGGLGRAYVWNTFQLESEGMLYHGGGTFGTSAWVSLYPHEGIAIFMVTPYVGKDTQGDLNGSANSIVAALRNTD